MSTKRQRAGKKKNGTGMGGDGRAAVGKAWKHFLFFSQHEVANASFRYATESKSSLQGWRFFLGGEGAEWRKGQQRCINNIDKVCVWGGVCFRERKPRCITACHENTRASGCRSV